MFQLGHNEDDVLNHLNYLVNSIHHTLNDPKINYKIYQKRKLFSTFQVHPHFHQKILLHLIIIIIKEKNVFTFQFLKFRFIPVIPVNRLLFKKCINNDEFIRAISVHKPAVPLQTCLCILSRPCTTANIELITNASFGSSL